MTTYQEERETALKFWMNEVLWKDPDRKIPRNALGVCVWCGNWITEKTGCQTHHGFYQRRDGVTINSWWNLWPVCSEECHLRLEVKANSHQVRLRQYDLMIKFFMPPGSDVISAAFWLIDEAEKMGLTNVSLEG